MDVASMAIYFWDFFLTIGMEVDLIWKSKWSFMKGLYLFQRYLPFINSIPRILYYQIGGSLTMTGCRNLYVYNSMSIFVGIVASEFLLTVRTWAVWNRNKRLSVLLSILCILNLASYFVLLALFLNSLIFSTPPHSGFRPCFLTYSLKKYLGFCWVLVIIWDTLMFMLTSVPGIRAYRSGGNSALIKVVYRDGVIYYLYLFVLSLINIVVVNVFPPDYQNLLTTMERMLHSVLASRVLLHIRAQAGAGNSTPTLSDGLAELNTITFAIAMPNSVSVSNANVILNNQSRP